MTFLLIASGILLFIAAIMAFKSKGYVAGFIAMGLASWNCIMLFGNVHNTHPYLWTSTIYWLVMLVCNFLMGGHKDKGDVYIAAGLINLSFFIISVCLLIK